MFLDLFFAKMKKKTSNFDRNIDCFLQETAQTFFL